MVEVYEIIKPRCSAYFHSTVNRGLLKTTKDNVIYLKKIPGNPDGFPLSVLGVLNSEHSDERPSPGPVLRAKLGQVFNVTFVNHMYEEVVSIHMHGLHMERNPWMDGTAGITECGIPPGGSFTYSFNITQTGTFWYHSHTGNSNTK